MGCGINRLRDVVRQGWTFSGRRFSSLSQQHETEAVEELGLEDITSLITCKCRMLVNPNGVHPQQRVAEDNETDPVKIFQKCWGWSGSNEFTQFEDAPPATASSSLSPSSFSTSLTTPLGDPSVLSRKQRMAEGTLLHEIAASIVQKGWNLGTQQEFRAIFPDLTPFHICHMLKAVQDPDLCIQVFTWAKQQPGFRHTTRSYNALLGVLAGRKSAAELAHLQEQMAKDGCPSDKVTLSTLIKGYSKSQQPNKVLEIYREMRDKEWIPGVVTYSCIIDMLAKHGYTDKAREVYFEMRMSGCYLDKTGYNIIISLFSRRKNLYMVTRLYNDMRECGLDPDGYTYAALIQAHLKLDDVINANKLFDEVLDKKLSVTLTTCNALIYALGKAGKLDLALQVYGKIESIGLQPDTLTYSTIVSALGQKKDRISDLYSVIQDMALKDHKEKDVAHADAVEWLVNAGKISTACNLVIDIIKKQGGACHIVVDTLLQSFVKLGALDQIHDFIKNMAALGFRLEASKFSDLVKTSGEAGNVDGALKIFYMLRELGYSPDQRLYDSTIVCLSKFGSLFQALRFFDDMSELGLTPSTDTCNHLIHMLCIKRDMKSATEIFNKMDSGRRVRNVVTYNQLIAGYANSSDWAMAFKLSKDMEESGLAPNSDTYLPLIFSLGNQGRMDHALELCKQMLDRGLKPSSRLCTKLLEMLARKCRKEEVLSAFTRLKEMGEFMDCPDYESYLVQMQSS